MPKKQETTSQPAGLEQMRALSHPLRLRLLELFGEHPRTTKQAAEALGESPTKLYHHVAALERAGLVRLRETRQNRGTTEKYFEVTQSQLLAKVDEDLLQNEEAQAAMGFVLFDQAREELARALSSGPGRGSVAAVRGILRLSRAEAKRPGEGAHSAAHPGERKVVRGRRQVPDQAPALYAHHRPPAGGPRGAVRASGGPVRCIVRAHETAHPLRLSPPAGRRLRAFR